MKEYKQESIPWREFYKDKFEKAGGELAYTFRAARKRKELTQAALAKKLDMPQSHISEIEHGKRPVGKKLAKKMAAVCQVNYRVFL